MRVARTVNHNDPKGAFEPVVLLMDSQIEVRTVIAALELYSAIYAEDEGDDSPTGHPATQITCLLIDQADEPPEPDEPYWKLIQTTGGYDRAVSAFKNADELQENLSNLIDKAAAIFDAVVSPDATPQDYTPVLNDTILGLRRAVADAEVALAKLAVQDPGPAPAWPTAGEPV